MFSADLRSGRKDRRGIRHGDDEDGLSRCRSQRRAGILEEVEVAMRIDVSIPLNEVVTTHLLELGPTPGP